MDYPEAIVIDVDDDEPSIEGVVVDKIGRASCRERV